MNLVSPPITPVDGPSGLEVGGAYGGALVTNARGGRITLQERSFSRTEFAFDVIGVTGTADLCARPSAGILACQGMDGDVALRSADGWTTLPRGEPVLAAPGLTWEIRATDTRVRIVAVRAAVLARLGDSLNLLISHSPSDFRSGRVIPKRTGTWGLSIEYVAGVAAGEVSSTAMVSETCARVLGTAALLCFPRAVAQQVTDDLDAHAPEQLRVALAFVADHAREDVGIHEIAGAVNLSTRAVQYLFRKHVDMTPTEYLRRVRLQGAHRDLIACDPAVTTVSDVASAWRFGHAGRFAAAYRERFGNSPHFILRR